MGIGMNKSTWNISELSKEFDVTTRSIRFYEDQGLLSPLRRGQTRIYSKQDRVRLKLILRGKRLGFSLAEIRELFDLYDASSSNNDKQLKAMVLKVHERLNDLEQQLQDLRIVQTELRNAGARCLESMSPGGRERVIEELGITYADQANSEADEQE